MFAGLRNQLDSDEGKLWTFVSVYLNNDDIRYLKCDNTFVASNNTLSIVLSVAGGCR